MEPVVTMPALIAMMFAMELGFQIQQHTPDVVIHFTLTALTFVEDLQLKTDHLHLFAAIEPQLIVLLFVMEQRYLTRELLQVVVILETRIVVTYAMELTNVNSPQELQRVLLLERRKTLPQEPRMIQPQAQLAPLVLRKLLDQLEPQKLLELLEQPKRQAQQQQLKTQPQEPQ